MEISDLVPSGSASVEGVFVERFIHRILLFTVHATVLTRSQELESFVLAFYCSLSIHATILTRSQELERFIHRILLFTVHTRDCHNTLART